MCCCVLDAGGEGGGAAGRDQEGGAQGRWARRGGPAIGAHSLYNHFKKGEKEGPINPKTGGSNGHTEGSENGGLRRYRRRGGAEGGPYQTDQEIGAECSEAWGQGHGNWKGGQSQGSKDV